MDLTLFDRAGQVSQEPVAIDPASLYRAFEKVKDGRTRKGTRYPLALVLTLIMLGKMAGETTIEGIIDWANLRKCELKRLLDWPKRFPMYDVYTRVLTHCDHQEVAKAIAQVILNARSVEQSGDEPSRLLAQKENEYSRCLLILHPLLVKGRILTTDAGIGYKEWCGVVHFMGGYYDIPIKDNHPVVRQDLILFFEDKGIDRSEFQYYKESNKGHGRLETREIWTSTQMNGFFEKDWPGIAQVWMIKRTVKEKGEERIEIVYGMTNLPRKKASASRLLELNRKHWDTRESLASSTRCYTW